VQPIGIEGDGRSAPGDPRIEIMPFAPGRRPVDEASSPWLGSSDQVAFLAGDAEGNRSYVLFSLSGIEGEGYALDATLSFTGPDGRLEPCCVPAWRRRPIAATVFEAGEDGRPVLREVAIHDRPDRPLVLAITPDRDLAAGEYSFAQRFSQRLRVELRLTRDGNPVADAHGSIECYDVRRFGSLYARLVERLVEPDTSRQARHAGRDRLSPAYHPWFPVLRIGAHKAELYTRALVGDIVHKHHNLFDPGWLVRVGLYLELLTCIGVMEAVRDEVGDLLTEDERAAYESGDAFRAIRERLNPDGWRRVWDMRDIAFPRVGTPRTGPVAATNLLNKRRATLEFLHAHHEDLKHAIELAGPNPHSAQETWHRVFRDAERAVLRQTPDAFPELGHLPPEVREFVLWHRRGHLGLRRVLRVPDRLAGLLGDQDGLFASACNQYRASMNHVADWAQARGLMDHTGEQSVPRQVSLLEAHMNQPSRVALLQGSDGYALQTLEVGAELPDEYEPPLADVEKLLAYASVFTILADDEIRMLARTARPLTFGPMERIIVQGEEGDSLFVVVEGDVEVVLRREDGSEASVDTMRGGTVVGEMSMLTGERRSATVRAIEGALVYEIGRHDYAPLLSARPQLADELRSAMQERLRARREYLTRYDADQRRGARKGIRRFLGAG